MKQARPKAAFYVVALTIIALVAYFAVRRFKSTPADKPTAVPTVTQSPPPGETVEVSFEYSTEKKDWIEAAVQSFQTANPTIKVKLIGKGSLEAAQAILDGTDKPVLWSPADSLVTNLLASDWQTKTSTELYPVTGDLAPQPLLLTPLVFAVWEDRAKRLLDASGGVLSWKKIHKAVSSPKGWPEVGGKPAWGFVKLGHTDPNKSNSGMQAIVLMAYEFFNITTGLTVEHMLDPKFQEFVRQIEEGVPHFEASTGTFMTEMIRFGPSKYDIALVYESLAISQLENAQGRWGSLHIYYPSTTIWSDHPVVVLNGPWVTPTQRAAADKLVAHLRSTPVQSTALRFGFRPADPAVPMKSSEATNPFTKMAQYGLSLELPPATRPPDGAVVRNMLMMWSRVVKRK
ncbi:MAG: substrate-binding domain-containing protein [Myxococcota bacterium]|nr:substrate-binding domain-containing protein [Deltaproteobacteria bacterium]MDQ3338733.1 substrate-binding domain-containing protein [Myxococcota bacterium]